METARTVVNDILQEILLQANEQPIEAVDAQFVVRYMNRYMAEISARGVGLGYTDVTTLDDNITVPAGATNGIVYNVAIEILNSYDMEVGPSLVAKADRSYNTMQKIARNKVRTRHPSTLPIGSGNECFDTHQHFYEGDESTIQGEINGSILVEDTTNEQ